MYQNLKAILDFQNSLKKTAQKHEAQLQTQNKRFILNNLGAQRIGNKNPQTDQESSTNNSVVFSPMVTITSPKPSGGQMNLALRKTNEQGNDLEAFLLQNSPSKFRSRASSMMSSQQDLDKVRSKGGFGKCL